MHKIPETDRLTAQLSLTNDPGHNSSAAASPTTPSSSGIRVENTVSVVSAPNSNVSDSSMAPNGLDRRVSFANELSVTTASADNNQNVVATSNVPTSAEEYPKSSSSQQIGLGDDNNNEIPESNLSANQSGNAQNTTTFANVDGSSSTDPVNHPATPVSNAQSGQNVQAEDFPVLQLSPFHQNSMTGRNTVRNYELPGEVNPQLQPSISSANMSLRNGTLATLILGP
jgi:hypothetical protein